tara:strand:+ start:199 stop:390 length:192 start_codon:yes stop_codon:yes gene_type:complete
MNKIKAKLNYKANFFEILENGDYVICAVSKKKISLQNLTYWNVDLQEAYYSPVEVKIRMEEIK